MCVNEFFPCQFYCFVRDVKIVRMLLMIDLCEWLKLTALIHCDMGQANDVVMKLLYEGQQQSLRCGPSPRDPGWVIV